MKLNYKRTFLVGFAFLSICAFWQMYDNIIPLMLSKTFGLGETVTGVLMAMDNVLAVFLLPILGALSDKSNSKYGKRTPFIVVGTVLAVIFILLVSFADRAANLPMFLIALFGALVAMGLYRSPAVALMPDVTPNVLRSKGNAVINLMGTVGGIYALLMISKLSGKVNAAGRTDYVPLFVSIVALMTVAVVVLVLTIKEDKLKAKVLKEIEDYKAKNPTAEDAAIIALDGAGNTSDEESGSKGEMAPEVKRSMAYLLASIFLWFTAYNAVTTAFSRYCGEVWGLKNGGYANCLMVATVAAVISYLPVGFLSSRFGRKKVIIFGVGLMSACYFAAALAGSYTPLINVGFALIGVGWASINVNSYPMVVEMANGADIGKYTGTYYTFSMMAQIFTPIASGFLLEFVSYRTLFPYACVFSLLAIYTMSRVHHGDVKPTSKKSLLENFDVDMD